MSGKARKMEKVIGLKPEPEAEQVKQPTSVRLALLELLSQIPERGLVLIGTQSLVADKDGKHQVKVNQVYVGNGPQGQPIPLVVGHLVQALLEAGNEEQKEN